VEIKTLPKNCELALPQTQQPDVVSTQNMREQKICCKKQAVFFYELLALAKYKTREHQNMGENAII
jgi:hypothetical protein